MSTNGRVVEKWKQKAYYIDHFIFETKTMLYRAKMVRFSVIREKNHTAESQSYCRDHH